MGIFAGRRETERSVEHGHPAKHHGGLLPGHVHAGPGGHHHPHQPADQGLLRPVQPQPVLPRPRAAGGRGSCHHRRHLHRADLPGRRPCSGGPGAAEHPGPEAPGRRPHRGGGLLRHAGQHPSVQVPARRRLGHPGAVYRLAGHPYPGLHGQQGDLRCRGGDHLYHGLLLVHWADGGAGRRNRPGEVLGGEGLLRPERGHRQSAAGRALHRQKPRLRDQGDRVLLSGVL